MIEKSEINIRHARQSDGAEVCNLLKKLGLRLPDDENRMADHWNRLWSQNPYYDIFDEEIFYGWVMEHNDKIVGFFGSIPRVYSLNGEFIPVSIGSHWGVDKPYRAFTMQLCKRYFHENPISLKLATTAIKPSAKIFERYKGKRIPDEKLGFVYMIPISLSKLVAFKYKDAKQKWLFKYGSYLIPWKLQFLFLAKNPRVTELKMDVLPKDFDAFLASYCHKQKGLIAWRSKKLFQWFYAKESRKEGKTHFVYTEDNQTLGYASIVNEPIKDSEEITRYKIVDLIANTDKIKKSLLKALIRYTYKERADILEIHHPGMIAKEEIPALFVMQRAYSYFPLYYQTKDEELEKILEDPNIWNISPYDGDTTL